MKNKHYVYVVNLEPREKISNFKKFKERNPNYVDGKPCVYVGQSSLKPEARFKQHKDGYKANRYAKKYGTYLRYKNTRVKEFYLSRDEAEAAEIEIAQYLRNKRGYAVHEGKIKDE